MATEYPKVVAAVALVAGSRAAAEDAVQEALARAWERGERAERIESPRAWVTAVALNRVRSGWRRVLVERRARGDVTPGRAAEPSGDAVDIRRALAALPRREREATVLRYYLDMDVAEVAVAMGVSDGTAKTALYRARRKLAVALGESLDEEPEEAKNDARR